MVGAYMAFTINFARRFYRVQKSKACRNEGVYLHAYVSKKIFHDKPSKDKSISCYRFDFNYN